MSKTKGFSLLCHPQGVEPIQAHPGGSKESEEQLSSTQKETQSGLKGTPQQKGKPQCIENEKNTSIIESLVFYNLLCDIEQTYTWYLIN